MIALKPPRGHGRAIRLARVESRSGIGALARERKRVMAEIHAVDGDELAELATALLPPERLAAAGVGSDEAHFRSAVSRASSSLVGQAAA